MLHNKGNTIPYYGEPFSGCATSLARKVYLDAMVFHSIFYYFQLII